MTPANFAVLRWDARNPAWVADRVFPDRDEAERYIKAVRERWEKNQWTGLRLRLVELVTLAEHEL